LLVDLQGLYPHHLENLTFSLDKNRRPAAAGEERIEAVDPAFVRLVGVESHTLLQINTAVLDVDLNGSVGWMSCSAWMVHAKRKPSTTASQLSSTAETQTDCSGKTGVSTTAP
jgi:hypothetical protein